MKTDLDEFIEWFNIIFKKEDQFSLTFGAPWVYYEYITSGELANRRGFSKSSFSRIKSRLISAGFLYKATDTEVNKEILVPLHPNIAIELAAYKHLTVKELVTERYGNIIKQIEEGWNDYFSHIFSNDIPRIFPVEGWYSENTYGNLLSWILALKDEAKEISLLTPHLRLLRNPVFKKILSDIQKEYGTKYCFYCLETSREEIINSDLKAEFVIIDPDHTNCTPYFDRMGVFYDKDNKPFFGFKYIKIEDLDKYVGFIFCRDERLKWLHLSLNNLKKASRVS